MKEAQINETIKFLKNVLKEEKPTILTFNPPRIGVFTEEATLRKVLNKKGIQRAYTVLNPVYEESLRRLPVNRLCAMGSAEGISAGDIQKYQFLFGDIDVVGLKQADGQKRNSTEEEHQEAFQVAQRAKKFLADCGFPEPAVIDSANGYHLLYAIQNLDATKSNEDLLKKCLRVLASKVDTDTCKVDTVVADMSRKIKLPGSANRLELKDARFSKIVELPKEIRAVSVEQLKQLSAMETGKSKGWKGSPGDDKVSTSDILDLVEEMGDYYYSTTGQVFADVRTEDNRIVTLNVMSEGYRLEARRRLKDVLQLRLMGNEMWKDTLSYLSVLASEQKERFHIYHRCGSKDGNIYVDMQNEDYESIEISKDGVAIVPTPPRLFQRLALDKEQIEPEYDEGFDYFGTIELLLNLKTREEAELLGITLITLFIPDIAKPIILFSGPHASGKSTACSILQDCISPQAMNRSAFPRKIDDLVVRLSDRCLCIFDNCERISTDASSILAQCATGGSYERRKLYTNNELVSNPLKSAVVLNSCEAILDKPDVLSRTLQFNLQSISGQKLLDDETIWKRYQKVKPYMLGYICFALSDYLNLTDESRIEYVTRMTEFQKAASKVARVTLGADSDYVAQLLKHNKQMVDIQIVESNPVAVLISDFMSRRSAWEGSVTELYDRLDQLAFESGIERSNRLYPKNAAALSMRLNSLVSVLENIGITFNICPEGKCKKIYIRNTNNLKTAHRARKEQRAEEPESEEVNFGGIES